MSTSGRTNKCWYIYTKEYYKIFFYKSMATYNTMWMHLTHFILSDRKLSQEYIYKMIPFV